MLLSVDDRDIELYLAKGYSMTQKIQKEEAKYPNSAELFVFCKEALNIKHNFEVKVIDQHVGSILGFDPADCSHWKKGKKNIRSLNTIQAIADHLDVDINFISDIAQGRISLEESIQEYKGYGPFVPSRNYYDQLKKDYYKNPDKFLDTEGKRQKFSDYANIDTQEISNRAMSLIDNAEITCSPVMLDEVLTCIEDIEIKEARLPEGVSVETYYDNSKEVFVIQHREGKLLPHIRFLIAREIGKCFYYPNLDISYDDELACSKLNLFAMHLLVPGKLLRMEAKEKKPTRDLVQQLAEAFWVTRSIMNLRLSDFFTKGL